MEITDNDEQFYLELLQDFQGETLLDDLLANLEGEDLEKVRLSAHALKGVSASLAFKKFNRVAVEIEQIA